MIKTSAASAMREKIAWNAPCELRVQCRSAIAATRTTWPAMGLGLYKTEATTHHEGFVLVVTRIAAELAACKFALISSRDARLGPARPARRRRSRDATVLHGR